LGQKIIFTSSFPSTVVSSLKELLFEAEKVLLRAEKLLLRAEKISISDKYTYIDQVLSNRSEGLWKSVVTSLKDCCYEPKRSVVSGR